MDPGGRAERLIMAEYVRRRWLFVKNCQLINVSDEWARLRQAGWYRRSYLTPVPANFAEAGVFYLPVSGV